METLSNKDRERLPEGAELPHDTLEGERATADELEGIRLAGEEVARNEQERAEKLGELKVDGERVELTSEEESRRQKSAGAIEEKTGWFRKHFPKKENLFPTKRNFKGAPAATAGELTAAEKAFFENAPVDPDELTKQDVAAIEHLDEEKPPVPTVTSGALSGSEQQVRRHLEALFEEFNRRRDESETESENRHPLSKQEAAALRSLINKGDEQSLSGSKRAIIEGMDAQEQYTAAEYEQMKRGEIPWKLNAVWQALRELNSGELEYPGKKSSNEPARERMSAAGTIEKAAVGAAVVGGVAAAGAAAFRRPAEGAKVEINRDQVVGDLHVEIDRLNAREQSILSEIAALQDDAAILEAVNKITDPAERMAKLRSESVDQMSEYYYDDPSMTNDQKKARFDLLLEGMDDETQAEFLNQQVDAVLVEIGRRIEEKKSEEAAVVREIESAESELAKYEATTRTEGKEFKRGDTVRVLRSDGTMEEGWEVFLFFKDFPDTKPENMNLVKVRKVLSGRDTPKERSIEKTVDLNDLKLWQKKEPAEPTTETMAVKGVSEGIETAVADIEASPRENSEKIKVAQQLLDNEQGNLSDLNRDFKLLTDPYKSPEQLADVLRKYNGGKDIPPDSYLETHEKILADIAKLQDKAMADISFLETYIAEKTVERDRMLAEAKAAIYAPTKGELPPEPDALTSYLDGAEPVKGKRTPVAEAAAKAAIAKAENLFERWKQKILKNVSAYEGDMRRIIADLGDTSKPADIAERLIGAEYISEADAETLTPSELYRLKDKLRADIVFLLDVAAGRIENPLIGKEKERIGRVEKAIAAEQDYLKPLLEDEAIRDSIESNLDTIARDHKTGSAADLEQTHYDLFAALPSNDAKFEELADTISMNAEARKSFAEKDKDRAVQLFSENWKALIAKMKIIEQSMDSETIIRQALNEVEPHAKPGEKPKPPERSENEQKIFDLAEAIKDEPNPTIVELDEEADAAIGKNDVGALTALRETANEAIAGWNQPMMRGEFSERFAYVIPKGTDPEIITRQEYISAKNEQVALLRDIVKKIDEALTPGKKEPTNATEPAKITLAAATKATAGETQPVPPPPEPKNEPAAKTESAAVGAVGEKVEERFKNRVAREIGVNLPDTLTAKQIAEIKTKLKTRDSKAQMAKGKKTELDELRRDFAEQIEKIVAGK